MDLARQQRLIREAQEREDAKLAPYEMTPPIVSGQVEVPGMKAASAAGGKLLQMLRARFPNQPDKVAEGLIQVEQQMIKNADPMIAAGVAQRASKAETAIDAMTPRVSTPVTVRAANSPPPVAPIQTARSDSGLMDERKAEFLRRRAAQGL